mmetsp:Transcript_117424/g.230429  ORF Transcript_117424/g.230429 Transcript_117424/m.230429 type:complete len:333 (-) Transcript_117424:183-1181(-)|eukprot:CAMPEP_0170400274 /NCGR_PEP_ID=MMETSP0117_2-20130122/24417_1 /TAXON_ID=400756 /ORGANISM="Durinskia baltica, Strain CSIRO CS-38" /LENGTH=332 /DNA_ID=CAMNT_0010657025 /DNA_START=79 /DNA_END=1077 /DNA_ORIENTATION=+
MSAAIEQRNQEATCYVGNLDEKVNEELLWEFMLQTGPVVNVFMPKDKVTGKYMGYGFVEYRSEDDAEYAIKVLNMVKLYNRPIKVNKATQDKKSVEVGANVFIGNLDPDVDEKLLYDTFSAFGGIAQTPKIMYDPDSGASKGYGFVSYDNFEASDLAIECMNGQFLCNRAIVVQYAYKKDTPGERHGSQAERILAASQPQKFKPHTHFSGGLGDTTVTMGSSIAAYQQQQMAAQAQMAAHLNPMLMHQMGMNMGYGGQMMPMMASAPSYPPQPQYAGGIPAPPPMHMHVPPPPPLPGAAPLPPSMPAAPPVPMPPPPTMLAMPPPPPPPPAE